jgi:hypothetical protein
LYIDLLYVRLSKVLRVHKALPRFAVFLRKLAGSPEDEICDRVVVVSYRKTSNTADFERDRTSASEWIKHDRGSAAGNSGEFFCNSKDLSPLQIFRITRLPLHEATIIQYVWRRGSTRAGAHFEIEILT